MGCSVSPFFFFFCQGNRTKLLNVPPQWSELINTGVLSAVGRICPTFAGALRLPSPSFFFSISYFLSFPLSQSSRSLTSPSPTRTTSYLLTENRKIKTRIWQPHLLNSMSSLSELALVDSRWPSSLNGLGFHTTCTSVRPSSRSLEVRSGSGQTSFLFLNSSDCWTSSWQSPRNPLRLTYSTVVT